MGLETSTTIAGMNAAWPLGTDPKSEGDNHLRLIKTVLKARFDDAVAGTLKLPNVSNLELFNAGVKRASFYGATGATASAGINAWDNAGVRKAELRFDAGGYNHYGGTGDIWWQSINDANTFTKFRVAYVAASHYTELVTFNSSTGARVNNIGIDTTSFVTSSLVSQWNAQKSVNQIAHYDWYGADAGVRRVVDTAGNIFLQKTNAAINVFTNYMVINAASSGCTFIADVLSDTGGFVTNAFQKGIHVASAGARAVFYGFNLDGYGLGASPKNNVEVGSWWGYGIRALTDNVVRWTVDTRTGNVQQSGLLVVGNATLFTDGNIAFAGTMANFGTYLSDALGQRAVINTQSSSGATGFPLGTILNMYTNGVQVNRNSLTNPCLSTADNIYYRLQGQPNAGTRLDGNWRALGHVGTDWVSVQRVP